VAVRGAEENRAAGGGGGSENCADREMFLDASDNVTRHVSNLSGEAIGSGSGSESCEILILSVAMERQCGEQHHESSAC